MVRAIIEELIGEPGRQVLYFYETNQLVLNFLVIAYGLLMFLSWSTLIRIYRHMVLLVARQIEDNPQLGKKNKPKLILSSVDLPWAEAVNAAKFPFIANNSGIIPIRKTVANAQSLFDEEELVKNAVSVLNGENIRKIMPSYRRMLQREMNNKNGRSPKNDTTAVSHTDQP